MGSETKQWDFTSAATLNTLKALADHGQVGAMLAHDGGNAEQELAGFTKAGVDIDALAEELQREGAESFVKSWDDLLSCIIEKSAALKKAS